MFEFEITREISRYVSRLDELRDDLDRVGPLPRVWRGRTRRDLEAEAVAASTAMEGVPVTADEVRRILVGDRPPGVSDDTSALVQGYRDAMAYVLNRADDPHFEWHPELVLAIHHRVLAGSHAAEAGRFRSIQNRIVDADGSRQLFLPPPPDSVPGLMADLGTWLTETGEVATPVRAAAAHIRMAAIHPFRDGNGRTARVMSSLVMYRDGFRRQEFTSLEEWWGRHRREYYDAFECLGREWDERADITMFIETHLRAQVTQVEALSLRRAAERAVWTVLEDLADEIGRDPRVGHALFDAFMGREVTNRYYRGMAGVSAVTAAADLSALLAAGLVERHGGGRSTWYVGTWDLVSRIARGAGLEPGLGADAATLREGSARVVAALGERLRGVPVSTPHDGTSILTVRDEREDGGPRT
jgi:Fic family protein